ncbi:colicin V production protein [Patescibacteria group bacterium]|nr:MAG: colicin V production protein [Patescibacteria group bacterium]
MSLLVTLSVIGLIFLAATIGWRYGLVAVGLSFLSLLGGIAAAALLYAGLGGAVADAFKIDVAAARLSSYLLILVAAQLVILALATRLVRYLPRQVIHSRFNQIGGLMLGSAQMILILAVAFGLVSSSSVPGQLKQDITTAPLVSPLVSLGERLQGIARYVPGQDVTDTLGLLTIDPQSDHTVMLGYTVTRVTVDISAEQRIFDSLNAERTKRGLPALAVNLEAQAVARAHSRDMFARGYFSHRTPEGKSPFDRMRDGGVKFNTAGENLALAPTTQLAHEGLMNSPGHRANILSPNYKKVGIGVVDGGRRGLMVTQNFTD